jgi:hypothetical protein
MFGSATIDGVTGDLGFNAQFSVGSGPGFIEITDFDGNLQAKADIIGYIEITSESKEFGLPGCPECLVHVTQTFNIVPTPEPASAVFVGAVLIGYAIKRRFSAKLR